MCKPLSVVVGRVWRSRQFDLWQQYSGQRLNKGCTAVGKHIHIKPVLRFCSLREGGQSRLPRRAHYSAFAQVTLVIYSCCRRRPYLPERPFRLSSWIKLCSRVARMGLAKRRPNKTMRSLDEGLKCLFSLGLLLPETVLSDVQLFLNMLGWICVSCKDMIPK